jgi:hypothetical protein
LDHIKTLDHFVFQKGLLSSNRVLQENEGNKSKSCRKTFNLQTFFWSCFAQIHLKMLRFAF